MPFQMLVVNSIGSMVFTSVKKLAGVPPMATIIWLMVPLEVNSMLIRLATRTQDRKCGKVYRVWYTRLSLG